MKKFIHIILFLGVVAGRAGQIDTIPAALCIPAADAARSAFTNQSDQFQFLLGFRFGYLESLIGQTYSSNLDKDQTPYASGFRAARQIVNQRRQTQPFPVGLNDFGYTPVEARGTIILGFEKANFTPQGETNAWWIRIPEEVRLGLGQEYFTLWRNGEKLSVEGWLSPEDSYGHMGMCKRELIVYRLTKAQSGSAKSDSSTSERQPNDSGTNNVEQAELSPITQ